MSGLKILLTLFICSITIISSAFAADKKPSRWQGTNASFGLTKNTGDANTTNINAGSGLNYAGTKWQNQLTVSYQMAYTDGNKTKSIFNGTENISHYISANKKTFLAGNVNLISDTSTDYRYSIVSSLNYGRTLINRKSITLDAQAGPGWRYNAPSTAGVAVVDRPVVVLLATLTWQVSRWGTFVQKGRAEEGSPYDYYQSVTSFTNKVSGHLAMQLSFQIGHYTKIPAHSSHTCLTNTTTLASLVYNF